MASQIAIRWALSALIAWCALGCADEALKPPAPLAGSGLEEDGADNEEREEILWDFPTNAGAYFFCSREKHYPDCWGEYSYESDLFYCSELDQLQEVHIVIADGNFAYWYTRLSEWKAYERETLGNTRYSIPLIELSVSFTQWSAALYAEADLIDKFERYFQWEAFESEENDQVFRVSTIVSGIVPHEPVGDVLVEPQRCDPPRTVHWDYVQLRNATITMQSPQDGITVRFTINYLDPNWAMDWYRR